MGQVRNKSKKPQPRRIPRPFEKWLSEIFAEDVWTGSTQSYPWLKTVRRIAKESGCRIILDTSRHWQESLYSPDYKKMGPTILAGGATNPNYSCTAILHELGHHILKRDKQHPRDMLRGEEAAWRIAQGIAQKHRLPLASNIRRQALYSYRYRLLLVAPGSKRVHRRRPLPKSWQLEGSRRSAAASVDQPSSMGKRGKRHAKRDIKRATSKAERRRKHADD